MTALSRARGVRGHGFQMHHYPSKPGDPLMSWRFEPLSLLTFFAAAKKVSAAPHRGNPNRPLRIQEKAKAQTNPKTASPRQPKSHYLTT
ncbi:hypothetical protein LMG27174_01121 [Paraburkholderia rhynchosiae]|uniref:Uncharacterized protein n=1 Tax=Paraburkholderia rhynchosiae TaxID=487049 RepID=A0A6J5AKW0_9BURK|nr:hypothetical protein LMG27174_01121 [Paraburkholderia rhynchosiae]